MTIVEAFFPVEDDHAPTGARLLVLEITDAGGRFQHAPRLAISSQEAIRDAWLAASALAPLQIAPRAFDEHGFLVRDLKGAVVNDLVEGASLGVAAFVAFAGLWAGCGVPLDAAFTGRIERSEGSWVAGKVFGVEAKATACVGWRFFVPKVNQGEAARSIAVHSLTEFWRRVGEGHPVPAAEELQVHAWKRLVDACVNAIVDGHPDAVLPSTGPGENTWLTLADRLGRLIALAPEDAAGITAMVVKAAAWQAIAYGYAGRPELSSLSALQMDGVRRGLAELPEDLANVEALVAMNALANVILGGSATDIGTALGRSEGAPMTGETFNKLGGRRFGTLGRGHLQLGDGAAAIPLLIAARDHHLLPARGIGQEVPRSRQYLARAYSYIGDHATALQELDLALQELSSRDLAPDYAETTRLFAHHERARTLVFLGRADDAVQALDQAFALLWRLPALEVVLLRTKAWALYGKPDQAEVLDKLGPFRVAGSPGYRRLIVEEAFGAPRWDGSVS